MNRFDQILNRADQLAKAEKAAKLLASKDTLSRLKALAFAACALFVALLPAGGAALTLL